MRAPTAARGSELKNGAELAGAQNVQFVAGANNLAFKVNFKQQGANALAAQVSAEGDQAKDNDRLEQSVTVGPPPRVLFVEKGYRRRVLFARQLRKQGVEVTVSRRR